MWSYIKKAINNNFLNKSLDKIIIDKTNSTYNTENKPFVSFGQILQGEKQYKSNTEMKDKTEKIAEYSSYKGEFFYASHTPSGSFNQYYTRCVYTAEMTGQLLIRFNTEANSSSYTCDYSIYKNRPPWKDITKYATDVFGNKIDGADIDKNKSTTDTFIYVEKGDKIYFEYHKPYYNNQNNSLNYITIFGQEEKIPYITIVDKIQEEEENN